MSLHVIYLGAKWWAPQKSQKRKEHKQQTTVKGMKNGYKRGEIIDLFCSSRTKCKSMAVIHSKDPLHVNFFLEIPKCWEVVVGWREKEVEQGNTEDRLEWVLPMVLTELWCCDVVMLWWMLCCYDAVVLWCCYQQLTPKIFTEICPWVMGQPPETY